jgi:hypothetical protein
MATNNAANLNVATQAQQETGSILTSYVAPGVQQYHPSAAKAWLQADAAAAITNSYNVSSVTDILAGVISPVWNVDFSSGNYVVKAMTRFDSVASSATTLISSFNDTGFTAGTCTLVVVRASDYTTVDPTYYMVEAFGDQ